MGDARAGTFDVARRDPQTSVVEDDAAGEGAGVGVVAGASDRRGRAGFVMGTRRLVSGRLCFGTA